MLKFRAWLLLFALCFINGCLLPAVAGIKPLWLDITAIPLAVIALGFGLDLSRMILRPVLQSKRRLHDETRAIAVLLVCVFVMPLPLALVLTYANFVCPGQMTLVTDFFTAWRVAAGLSIVSAFLRWMDYPISLRSIQAMFVEAYSSKEL